MAPPQWTFDEQDLARALSPKTRGIMINTPANPSGKVFTYEELERLAAFAKRYDLFVFTDEIYEHEDTVIDEACRKIAALRFAP